MQSGNTLIEGAAVAGQNAKKFFFSLPSFFIFLKKWNEEGKRSVPAKKKKKLERIKAGNS